MSRPTRQPATYIMASARNGTLYAGVTANLPHRVTQHRHSLIPGFTAKHRCHTWSNSNSTPTCPPPSPEKNN